MATKREYLVSIGLAKPTRGKFTALALAALAEAEAKGMEFDAPVTPAPKPKVTIAQAISTSTVAPSVPKPGPPNKPAPVSLAKTPKVEVNAKEVRAWARANGHTVGERGRIHPTVISAFLASGGKAVGPVAKAPKPTPAVKVRPNKVMFGLVRRGDLPKHISEPVLAITSCFRCKAGTQYCACTSGPILPKWAGGEVAQATKPTV